jgi:ribosomal protein S18 acetylase RimI-like enzyme
MKVRAPGSLPGPSSFRYTPLVPSVAVTRTYLQMDAPSELRAAQPPEPAPTVERVRDCSVKLFRRLYAEVGRAYHWMDRLGWSDEEIRRHLENPAVSLWLLSWEGEAAGYFELKQDADGAVEIAYFGLLPQYLGRGWGKFLLTEAVRAAWSLGAARVWLHTCTLDHPAALPNYLRCGFRRVREEVYTANLP